MKKAQCRNFANEVYRWYSAMSKHFETSLFRKFNHKLLYVLDYLVVSSQYNHIPLFKNPTWLNG